MINPFGKKRQTNFETSFEALWLEFSSNSTFETSLKNPLHFFYSKSGILRNPLLQKKEVGFLSGFLKVGFVENDGLFCFLNKLI